jgi:hypothetical protein
MRSNVVFEELDSISLLLIIFFRPFYKKVFFRTTKFKIDKIHIKTLLKLFNIKWLSYINLNRIHFIKALKGNIILENSFKKDLYNNSLLNRFLKEENLDKNKKYIERVHRCLINSLGVFKLEVTSLYLIRIYLKNQKTFYFPNKLFTLIILKNIKQKYITIGQLHIYFLILKKIFYNLPISFLKIIIMKILFFLEKINQISIKKNIVKSKKINNNDCKVLYFPHDSIIYGDNLFNKNFLFKIKYKKFFLKKNIFVIFYDIIDKFNQRFFSLYRINFFYLKNLLNLNIIKNSIFKTLKNIKVTPFSKLTLMNLFISIFILKYHVFIDFLSKFKNLKLVYIFYDGLFTSYAFLCACLKMNIKTMSHVERGIIQHFFSPLFFNYYVIPGSGFKKDLINNGYLVDKYLNFGFLRTELVDKKINKNKIALIKLDKIKEKKKIILCLGTLIGEYKDIGFTANQDVSISNNISFLKSINKLASENKDCYFIIKYKTKSLFKIEQNKELITSCINQKNIELFDDYKNISSYNLVKISDLIISTYTSILDEILPLNKKIICWDQYQLKSTNYIFKDLNLDVSHFKDLKKKFNKFLQNKDYYNPKQKKIMKLYFPKKTSVENSIGKFILKSLRV